MKKESYFLYERLTKLYFLPKFLCLGCQAWYYEPGTPIGITEYNWGAESHINGVTTQADILGLRP